MRDKKKYKLLFFRRIKFLLMKLFRQDVADEQEKALRAEVGEHEADAGDGEQGDRRDKESEGGMGGEGLWEHKYIIWDDNGSPL